MMYKTLIVLCLLSSTHAFLPTTTRPDATTTTAVYSTTQDKTTIPNLDELVRAVDCASHFGKCSVEDLHSLADTVEAMGDATECVFENAADLCDKEAADRVDVAELLRLQAELQLGMEYLEKANLFKHEVMAEHDMIEREAEMEILSEDGI